jgi:protein involved in polysaccharide export with SLBB domain
MQFDLRSNLAGLLSARWLAASILFAVCLQVSACEGGADLGPATSEQRQAAIAAAAAPPRLQPGEKIRITVYGEPSLSGDYQIDPSGYISVPLAGTIKAAGKTQIELEKELPQDFGSEILKDPKISVSLVEFRPFYILGEVEKPGAYPYSGGLNVMSALAIAGGPTYRASRSRILIQHPGESGMHEYDLDPSVPVLPGDLLELPRRYF